MQKPRMEMCEALIKKLKSGAKLDSDEYLCLIENRAECAESAFAAAAELRNKIYGKQVYIRGLIEFTNYCKNDCFLIGFRPSNTGRKFLNVQKTAMSWDFAPLCCKAERMHIIPMRCFAV